MTHRFSGVERVPGSWQIGRGDGLGGADLGGPGAVGPAAMAASQNTQPWWGRLHAPHKHRLGWVAYAVSGLSRLSVPPGDFTIRLDGGEPLWRRARCVVVER